MWARHYFFLASYAAENTRAVAHGIVVERSLLPRPRQALDNAINRVCLEYGWPREQVLIEEFHAC